MAAPGSSQPSGPPFPSSSRLSPRASPRLHHVTPLQPPGRLLSHLRGPTRRSPLPQVPSCHPTRPSSSARPSSSPGPSSSDTLALCVLSHEPGQPTPARRVRPPAPDRPLLELPPQPARQQGACPHSAQQGQAVVVNGARQRGRVDLAKRELAASQASLTLPSPPFPDLTLASPRSNSSPPASRSLTRPSRHQPAQPRPNRSRSRGA